MNAKQILIAVLLAFLTSFLNGQILIESNVQQSLNDELKSKFDEFFLKNPAYESFGIIKFNSSDQAKPVDFVSLNYNAVGEELEVYEMTYFKSDSLNGNYWEGKSQDKSCSFSFFSNNAGYFGTINRNNYSQILRVFPLDSITSIAVQASSYLEIKDLSCGTQFVSECIPNLDFCGDNPMDNSGCEETVLPISNSCFWFQMKQATIMEAMK